MPTAKPLKKRIEDLLDTVIQAQFTADSLTCDTLKSHDQGDKPALPYLLIVCESVPNHPDFPTTAGVKAASIILSMVSNVDEDNETVIDACLQSSNCAMEDTAAMKAEALSNYTDIAIHEFEFNDENTDRDQENFQYDFNMYGGILEYIDIP
jgi:hypothetical protein